MTVEKHNCCGGSLWPPSCPAAARAAGRRPRDLVSTKAAAEVTSLGPAEAAAAARQISSTQCFQVNVFWVPRFIALGE